MFAYLVENILCWWKDIFYTLCSNVLFNYFENLQVTVEDGKVYVTINKSVSADE